MPFPVQSFSLPEEEKEGEGGEQLSGSLRALIVGLLTTPDQRLGFTAITTHSFFAGTDWDNLTAGFTVCLSLCVVDLLPCM